MMKRKSSLSLSLSLSRRRFPRTIIACTVVFFLCLTTGLFSGALFRANQKLAEAASANITVTDNNQVVTEDQGTTTIQRTSTVTVKDTAATLGYALAVRIENNSIPNSIVTIYSVTSTTCTQASPCTLTSDPTPTPILETNTTEATQSAGHTTGWVVTVTLPGATAQGNYILDIAYGEEPVIPPPPLQNGDNMQDATAGRCDSAAMGTTVNLKDTRDNKTYRVRKMADSRCWMIDNLAYDINTAPATGKPAYNPTAQLVSGSTASVNNRAQYAQNTTAYNIPNNGSPTPSYLYNWCAAMGDTSANCAVTVGYGAGQPSTPQTGICPAPFRLPITGTAPFSSTPGNGSNQATAAATTTSEFAKLDIWMGGTGTSRYPANTFINFTTDNATNPQLFWLGVLGGYYYSGLGGQGSSGNRWSSTASSSADAYDLNLGTGGTGVSPSSGNDKISGYAVRCIL